MCACVCVCVYVCLCMCVCEQLTSEWETMRTLSARLPKSTSQPHTGVCVCVCERARVGVCPSGGAEGGCLLPHTTQKEDTPSERLQWGRREAGGGLSSACDAHSSLVCVHITASWSGSTGSIRQIYCGRAGPELQTRQTQPLTTLPPTLPRLLRQGLRSQCSLSSLSLCVSSILMSSVSFHFALCK